MKNYTSPLDYSQKTINFHESQALDPDYIYRLVRSDSVTISNQTGWKIDFTYGIPGFGQYHEQYYFVIDDKVYKIVYSAPFGEVPQKIPIYKNISESMVFDQSLTSKDLDNLHISETGSTHSGGSDTASSNLSQTLRGLFG